MYARGSDASLIEDAVGFAGQPSVGNQRARPVGAARRYDADAPAAAIPTLERIVASLRALVEGTDLNDGMDAANADHNARLCAAPVVGGHCQVCGAPRG